HGFVRSAGGTIMTFDVPGAAQKPGNSLAGTQAFGINNDGTIVGTYAGPHGLNRGFMRSADGTITTFNPSLDLFPVAIDDKGIITGRWTVNPIEKATFEGFIRQANGGLVRLKYGTTT